MNQYDKYFYSLRYSNLTDLVDRMTYNEDFHNRFPQYVGSWLKGQLVCSVAELVNETNDPTIAEIVVSEDIVNRPTIRLSRAQ